MLQDGTGGRIVAVGTRAICEFLEESVEGVAAGRTLVAARAHQLEMETGQLEQAPQEEALAPVAVDDFRAVRPEKLCDMTDGAGEANGVGRIQVHGLGLEPQGLGGSFRISYNFV